MKELERSIRIVYRDTKSASFNADNIDNNMAF